MPNTRCTEGNGKEHRGTLVRRIEVDTAVDLEGDYVSCKFNNGMSITTWAVIPYFPSDMIRRLFERGSNVVSFTSNVYWCCSETRSISTTMRRLCSVFMLSLWFSNLKLFNITLVALVGFVGFDALERPNSAISTALPHSSSCVVLSTWTNEGCHLASHGRILSPYYCGCTR